MSLADSLPRVEVVREADGTQPGLDRRISIVVRSVGEASRTAALRLPVSDTAAGQCPPARRRARAGRSVSGRT